MLKSITFDFSDLNFILLWTCIWTAFYYYILRSWNYFQRQGIAFDRGVPPFGSYYRKIFNIEPWLETVRKLYYQFPNDRFIGLYEIGGGVGYLIRDPELIKDITTKNFDHFVNRYDEFDTTTDPLYSRMLTALKDDSWRDMRSVLTPLFTGSKFRSILVPAMIDAQKQFVNYLDEVVVADNGDTAVSVRDYYNRLVMDAFSRCALGVETDAVTNKNSEFIKAYDDIINHMKSLKGISQYAVKRYPKLMKHAFGVTALSKVGGKFFEDLIKDVAAERERNNVDKSDFLGLVVNARKGKGNTKYSKIENSEVEMISQCLVFFLSVITENSVLLSFITETLAEHTDIQERLYNEIVEVNQQLNGENLTMETLRDMKYMDMVISEALRIVPIAPELKRRATKPYTLINTNGASIQIQPGDAVWMPANVIQNDPKYFPEPNKFDPERFSDANKNQIQSGSYAPFGLGSRDCIGCRYVVMEVKISYFYLLQRFIFLRDKTVSGQCKAPVLLRKR